MQDDDEEDELENAFLNNAMSSKQDAKRIEKLVKGAKATIEGEDEDFGEHYEEDQK